MFLKFLKLPKYQRYEYKPRYWDPQKEEMEKRIQQIKDRQNGVSAESVRARIASGGIRRGFEATGHRRRQQTMRSNFILIGVIIALLFLAYMLLNVYLPEFEEMLNNKQGGASEF